MGVIMRHFLVRCDLQHSGVVEQWPINKFYIWCFIFMILDFWSAQGGSVIEWEDPSCLSDLTFEEFPRNAESCVPVWNHYSS